jgi:hypothetical protein
VSERVAISMMNGDPVMKLGHTVKRVIFTSSPLILSLVAMQAGCSSDGGGGVGAGVIMPTPVNTGEIVDAPPAVGDGPKDLPGFKGSEACKKCHVAIYEDWESSMHAHALTSPIMIVQTNQVFAADLLQQENQGLGQFCTNCHSPIATLFAKSGTLPFVSKKANATTEALQEGIGCVTCHAYRGNPKDSKAVLTDFQQDFAVGKNYFGPFDDPAPNGGFHQATTSPLFTDGKEQLCFSCHNVKNDRDGDNIFELGTDLFLQTTFDEYEDDYRAQNGEQTCNQCHMPERGDVQQAADGFPNAPFRTVHDHKFAGVDYPLDEFAKGNDPQKFARRDLLNGGATGDAVASLSIQNINFADGANLSFDVEIINSNGGHSLPTGFAFTRQMWLEVVVKDNDMNELGSSGLLRDVNNDLCDNDTLIDNLANVVQGCQNNLADPQLVNFQTILVDFVALQDGVLVKDPVKGHETWLQFQSGGAVARSRPADVAAGLGNFTVAPIKAFDARTFNYKFTFGAQDDQIRLGVKLKFRNLPPYFVRRLAAADSGKFVKLGSLLSFDVIDMQSDFQNIQVGQVD